MITPLASPRRNCGDPASVSGTFSHVLSLQIQRRRVPAVAQHIRLDLQRNLLGWDGERKRGRHWEVGCKRQVERQGSGDRVRGPIARQGGERQDSVPPLSALGKEPQLRSSRPVLSPLFNLSSQKDS